jgi:predicted acetyltransferase
MNLVMNTEKEDFSEVVGLINHVFGKENSSTKMEDIFSDLLCKDNMEHMRIIKADGKPVSVINYVINEIDINGCIIKAANIGAVCTHEDYRCRGYSNLILKDCLDKMREEGVDFLYVSGDISLYTKNNIHITGVMHQFSINPDYLSEYKELHKFACEVKECSQKDFYLLSPIYDEEAVKFIRDNQRFSDLASRVPGASVFNQTSKIFCIEENGQMQGYFICAVDSKDNGGFTMEIIEYAGNRKSVLAGIIKILIQLKPASISGYISCFDVDMLKTLEEYKINTETCNYPGTMRIINFSQLMQKLKPLYAQDKNLENIEFYEIDGKYVIRSGDLELVIQNDKVMHNLFLGNDMDLPEAEHIDGDHRLLDSLKLILPISVPYPNNLNYI